MFRSTTYTDEKSAIRNYNVCHPANGHSQETCRQEKGLFIRPQEDGAPHTGN
jgi:hypothetical protein